MDTFVHCRIHEREQSVFCHDGYSVKQHIFQGGREQQQHNDTANLVSKFIMEEILVTMRKRLEMEAKSYAEEEQQSSQLSLPFDFKTQYDQYHMSSK